MTTCFMSSDVQQACPWGVTPRTPEQFEGLLDPSHGGGIRTSLRTGRPNRWQPWLEGVASLSIPSIAMFAMQFLGGGA